MKKLIILASLFAMTTPAVAAEYYIVRGADKKCRVVEKRPTAKTMVVVGNKAYVTKKEATSQLKVACKSA